MRRPLTALAAFAMAGGLLLAPQTANAQTAGVTPPVAGVQETPPLSPLKVTAYYPRRVYAGRTITYTLKIKNVGKWYTDIAYVAGETPKQAYKVRVTGPKGSYCEADADKREIGCLLDRLDAGESATVKVKVWLRSSARGTATAEFASASIDVPAGGIDTLDMYGLETGVDLKYVKVKTKIVRR
ncbi:hypothetical protein ACFOWE_09910 [Planomonospora corallina]|uniref:DUF11 domain-containing protein n=1 Tax=Planomonospora corallina TaxID=1806052 RepID=A0ABV8I3I8_9ACTN